MGIINTCRRSISVKQNESEDPKQDEQAKEKYGAHFKRNQHSPGVEEDMHKNGKPDRASPVADVSEKQANKNGVDALNDIQMENAE